MHRLKKISPILAVLIFLVLTGTVLASLSPPSVSQNGNSFRVSMTPLDGSVRNWIYYHKAALVGESNSVDVCVPGGGWVQFRAVSVLAEDNSLWDESYYTDWYEVPDGSCGLQNPPPAPTPTPDTYEPCIFTLFEFAPEDGPDESVLLIHDETMAAYSETFGEDPENLIIWQVELLDDGRIFIDYYETLEFRSVSEEYRGCEFLGHTEWEQSEEAW
ncbi:MAG: hypothetical protein OXH93_13015 [Caldilineaceae bacterium]|nr:hypothetical protein [Caldilineaceae bacterium]